ncbi:MAG: hypothetical protein RMA76_39140 [Deltaproteobacteria bacterium]
MRKRILVVASDEATIDGLEAALEKIGLEPVVMRDRASVLARFEDLRPSAILMSVGRGPVDPLHVVAAIRDSARGAIVPLLLMGSADPSETITSPSEALEAGADYYFRLPTDLDYLAGRVAGWVGETHSTRPRPAQPIAEPRDGLSQDLDLEAFSLPSFDQEAVTEHGLPTLDLLREAEARRHDAALPGAPMGDDVHEDDEPTKGIFDVPDEMPVPQPRTPSRQVELALQLVREGERHRREGNTNEAIDAYWAASETYVLDGRTSEAIALYKLILYLDPTRYVVARHGADIALQSGRKKDALDMYRHTARALEEAGRLDEATQVLREMVHMSPSEPTLVLRLAAIESRSQRTAAPRGPSLGAWGRELDAQLEAHEEGSLPELDVEPPTLDEGPTATKEVAPEALEPMLQRERAARVAEADALVVPDTIEISDPRVHMSLQASDTIPNQRVPKGEDDAEIGDPPQVIRAPPRAEPDEDRKKLLEAARQIDWERATRARKLQNARDTSPRPPTALDDEAEALTPLPTEAAPRRPDDTAPSAPVRGAGISTDSPQASGRERPTGDAAPPTGASPASPAGEPKAPAVPVDDLQSPDALGVAARSSSATDPIHADRVASPRAATAADPSLPNPGPRPRSPARTPTVTDPSLPDGEAPYAREPPPRGITTTEPVLQEGAATEGPEAPERKPATETPEASTPDEASNREPLPRPPTQTDPVPVVDRPPSARTPPARATSTTDAGPERVATHRAATVSEAPRPSAPRAPSPTKPDAEPIVRPKEPTSTTKPRRPTVPATAELTGDLPSDGGTSDLDEPRKHRRPRPEPSRITFAPLVPNHGKVERLFDALIVFSLASTQRVTGILRMQGDEGLVFFEGHPAARRGARAHERLRQFLDRAGIALDRLVEDPPPSAADSIRTVVEAGLAQEELAQAILHRHLEDGVLSALAYRGPWKFLQNNDVDIAISEIVKNRDDVIAQLVEILPQMAPPLELASHLGGTRARVRLEELPDCGLSARDARFCSWLDGTKPLDVAATLGGLSMERAAAIALVLVAFGHGTSSGQPVPTELPTPAAPPAPEPPPPSSGVMPHEALRSLEPRARLAALAELVRTSDYFTILGVDGSATKHQIDEAHHHLRRMIDVEAFESEPSLRATAREVARSLDEARDVLKVPQLRAAYQRHLKP